MSRRIETTAGTPLKVTDVLRALRKHIDSTKLREKKAAEESGPWQP